MVNDLCFLPVLLFLLLLPTIAAFAFVGGGVNRMRRRDLKISALAVAVARACEKEGRGRLALRFYHAFTIVSTRALSIASEQSWIIQSLCPAVEPSFREIGEKLRSGVGHGWRAKESTTDGRIVDHPLKKETNEEKVHQTHHWLTNMMVESLVLSLVVANKEGNKNHHKERKKWGFLLLLSLCVFCAFLIHFIIFYHF